MCCIFTCCGWMIDLLQRAWVFFMSCCISSAVCCMLITSSMSGVALGYNYSLAEYIDLKETNVSVYMKRGVFDDEVAEDMDWRRRGHQPLKGIVRDEGNLKTGGTDEPEQMPLESGRRLEDSILESNQNKNFEGSLMKLTMPPPFPSTTLPGVTSDMKMAEVVSNMPAGSLDQLKSIQGIINMRKAAAARNPLDNVITTPSLIYNDRYLVHMPNLPVGGSDQARRMFSFLGGPGIDRPEVQQMKDPNFAIVNEPNPQINPARFAVPSSNSKASWLAPKMSPEVYRKVFNQYDDPPAYPKPVTYTTGPIRPTTIKTTISTATWQSQSIHHPSATDLTIDKDIEKLKARIGDDKYAREGRFDDLDKFVNEERFASEEKFPNEDAKNEALLDKPPGPKIIGHANIDYYEDEIKGLPVRRRRNINNVRGKLHPQVKVAKVIPQKRNLDVLTKFKVGKSISNEITDYPSLLVSKLHFSNNILSSEPTSTNEKEEINATKTVRVTANDTDPITNSSIDKVLSIIQSMFS